MELGEWWDMIAQSVNGSDSTYYCDGFWYATTGELLSVGGRAANGARCGLSSAISNNAFSGSDSNLGARLAFYGEPEIVSGAQLVALTA